jgi:hypothetical protein
MTFLYLFIIFLIIMLLLFLVIIYLRLVTEREDDIDYEACSLCDKVTPHHWGICTICGTGRSHLRGR